MPTAPVGERLHAEDWGLFDGPADLSARTDEYLGEGFAR